MPAHSLPQQLRGAADIELLFDARAVCLHRLYADGEILRDLPGPDPLPQLLEHFQLAIAQAVDGRLAGCPAAHRLGRENLGGLLADIELAIEHAAHRLHHPLCALTLVDVATRSSAEHTLGIQRLV